MNVAVILAGGVGARIGAEVPKQFIPVLGKPVMAYTMEKFQNNPNIDAIEVVCHREYMAFVREMAETYGLSKVRWYAEGGSTFQASTVNGIMRLKDVLEPEDLVLLGFAVSPMVSDEIIDDAIRVASIHGNAIPADEIIMCTCLREGECSKTSVLRESLAGLNAPQTFRYGEVLAAYEEAMAKGILDSLEPHTTSLYFALGKTLYFSKSATNNIKITRKEDLDLFEGYLLLQQKRLERSGL